MKVEFLRSAYNYDGDAVSRETAIDTGSESIVQGHLLEEVDINTIVHRFGLTGEIPQGIGMPMTGDFTSITTFQDAMNMIKQSEQEFYRLPAEVRARFNNDPGAVIAFMEDERNRDEAIKLGILPKPPEKTRDAVQAIDDLAKQLTPKT